MFDIIVRLILSLALISMGLSVALQPRAHKAFIGNLKGSINHLFARSPDWIIRGLGVLLMLAGGSVFIRLVVLLHPIGN